MGAGELGYRYGRIRAATRCSCACALSGHAPWIRDDPDSTGRGAQARFPVKANDLKPDYTGPALGQRLRELESRWIASGFTLTREDLL